MEQSGGAWSNPAALIATLWTDARSREVFEAVNRAALALPSAIQTARKGYTAWSRQVQFAALRPLRQNGAMLGLAVPPGADARLEAPRSESWSERLKSRVVLPSPDAVDAGIIDLLRRSWEGA